MIPLPEVVREQVQPATLEASDVTVRYGGVVAVNDVSFTVNPGEIIGLIGPNGAGKTTLIDAITGFVQAGGRQRPPRRRADRRCPCYQAGAGRRQPLVPVSSSCSRSAPCSTTCGRLRRLQPRCRTSRDLVRPDEPAAARSTAVGRRPRVRPRGGPRRARAATCPTGAAASSRSPGRSPSQPAMLLLDEPAAGLSDVETAELGHARAPPGRGLGHRRARSSSTT